MAYTSLFDRHGFLIWTNYHATDAESPVAEGMKITQLVDEHDSDRVEEACGRVLISKRSTNVVGHRDGQLFEATVSFVGQTELLADWHWHNPNLLTAREAEILTMICHGETASVIGKALGIKTSTVDAHKAHLKEKTGCNGTAQLVRWAIRHGYLRP